MLNETDINEVRNVMKAFLYLPLEQDEKFGFIIHHPIFSNGVSISRDGELVDMVNDEVGREKVIKAMEETIDKTDLNGLFVMLNPPYYLTFLKFVKGYLSLKDFSELLSEAWTLMENPNADVNVSKGTAAKWFREADKKCLMEEDEYEHYMSLPDEMTVYRGVANGRVKKGMSWTDNREKAEWFASRFGGEGYVLSGKVKKEDVLAYFNRRDEYEVVVEYRDVKETK